MNCKMCGKKMTFGTPESKEIKFKLVCRCGHTETVKYTPSEQAARNGGKG